MPLNLRLIVHTILEDYALSWNGTHGVAHWARVFENGLRLAEMTGADPEIVQLFALLHDSKRVNEGTDPDHGRRAAEFAKELQGRVFHLRDREFGLLQLACAGHTDEQTHPDVTVQTCWDADRLDLGRVGIMPEPSRLCTAAAKRSDLLKWADGRACFGVVPKTRNGRLEDRRELLPLDTQPCVAYILAFPLSHFTKLARPTMAKDPNTTEPKMSKTAVIIAALQAHPDKMPKELAELLQAEGWDINAQRISVVKSKLKDRNKRKARRKPTTKTAPVEAPAVGPVPAATMAEDGISFDSLKKAKQMAEQLGGVQQAKAAIAALAELVD